MSNSNAVAEKLEALVYTDFSVEPNRTVYFSYLGGKTQEEIDLAISKLKAEGNQNVRALTWSEYEAIENQEALLRYNVNKPTVIDEETFDEKLNVLPPCNWLKDYDFESFYLSECITGNIFSFYVRIRENGVNHYFEVNAERGTSRNVLRELCEKKLNDSLTAV